MVCQMRILLVFACNRKSFLNILPKDLRTSGMSDEDIASPISFSGTLSSCGYEQYIQEANR
ncbi:hypothetical protein J437_LFUL005908 [Ladona fulva]|uniref:Uncharacterized protein n=1 Tax=Ladona fulva TaxID=123851 RepID=A0A8K0K9X1_LADFU|nr:hypothetical protein J437_LFUL005908 [Ladona fulva]